MQLRFCLSWCKKSYRNGKQPHLTIVEDKYVALSKDTIMVGRQLGIVSVYKHIVNERQLSNVRLCPGITITSIAINLLTW